MKNKVTSVILSSIGLILFIMPIVLATVKTLGMNVIGGPGFSTFVFVFTNQCRGRYPWISLCGVLCIVATIILSVLKNKKR